MKKTFAALCLFYACLAGFVNAWAESTVSTPAISPNGGTFAGTQTVTITSPTSGASIRYTTNGAPPNASSSALSNGGNISISTSVTVKAYALLTGFVDSSVASATFSQQVAATPTFSPAGGGSYITSVNVTLTSATSGATIYYTTDGSTPTTSSASVANGNSVPLTTSVTLKAMAVKSGLVNSAVAASAGTYWIQAATPVISPNGSTFVGTQSVTITSHTSGATIRYTLDNSTPTSSSTFLPNGGSFSVPATTIVKAIAIKAGCYDSGVATATFNQQVAMPVISPSGSTTFIGTQSVTITSSTPGATIRYTLDNSPPTASSFFLANGNSFPLSSSATVRAIAVLAGCVDSGAAAATFNQQAAAPALSPNGGSYTTSVNVTLTSATSGTLIYYTTDNSTPTASSASVPNGGSVLLTVSANLKAMAAKSGLVNSAVTTSASTYWIQAATPAISPNGGSAFIGSQTVTLTSATSGTTIYYTTDGSPPGTGSASVPNGGSFPVTTTTTVRAIAIKPGCYDSGVAAATFTQQMVATPAISPGADNPGLRDVTLTCATPGATIYYVTNSTTLDTSSPSVGSGGTVTLSGDATIQAFAAKAGYANSFATNLLVNVKTLVTLYSAPPGVLSGHFTLMRSGGDLSASLSVNFTLSGPAATDFSITSPSPAVIPANQRFVVLSVTPITKENKSLTMTLTDTTYVIAQSPRTMAFGAQWDGTVEQNATAPPLVNWQLKNEAGNAVDNTGGTGVTFDAAMTQLRNAVAANCRLHVLIKGASQAYETRGNSGFYMGPDMSWWVRGETSASGTPLATLKHITTPASGSHLAMFTAAYSATGPSAWMYSARISDLVLDGNWAANLGNATPSNFKSSAVDIHCSMGLIANVIATNFGAYGVPPDGLETFPLALRTYSGGPPYAYTTPPNPNQFDAFVIPHVTISNSVVRNLTFANLGYATAIFLQTSFPSGGNRMPLGTRLTEAGLVKANLVENLTNAIAYGTADGENINFIDNTANNSKLGFNADTGANFGLGLSFNQFQNCRQGVNLGSAGDTSFVKCSILSNTFTLTGPLTDGAAGTREYSFGVRLAGHTSWTKVRRNTITTTLPGNPGISQGIYGIGNLFSHDINFIDANNLPSSSIDVYNGQNTFTGLSSWAVPYVPLAF